MSLQISKEELATAMSFLSQQLGEDELRHLLEQLSAFDDKCARHCLIRTLAFCLQPSVPGPLLRRRSPAVDAARSTGTITAQL